MLKKAKKTSRKGAVSFKKKCLLIAAFICIIGTVVAFGISGFVRLKTEREILPIGQVAEGSYDCILVLGAGVYEQTPSLMLRDRLNAAIALYQSGAAPKIIMSGDHGTQVYNEVGVMKAYAIEQGVPSSDIFMDHAGFSTYESLYRVKSVFGCQKVLIVTQEYHLYRALYLGKHFDLEVAGVSANPEWNYYGQFLRDLREVLARDKDFFTAVFKPLPSAPDGDPISISGDGNVTNDDAFAVLAEQKGIPIQ